MQEQKKPQGRPIPVQIQDPALDPIFANIFRINPASSALVVDFGIESQGAVVGKDNKQELGLRVEWNRRVVLPPQTVERLHEALGKVLEQARQAQQTQQNTEK